MEGSTKSSSRAPAFISEKHPLEMKVHAGQARKDTRTLDAAEHARVVQLHAGVRAGKLELQQMHGQWASPLSLDKAPVSLAVFQEWQPTPASASYLSNSCLLHLETGHKDSF